MQTITLNNGVEMPRARPGVFQARPDETRDAVRAALTCGYRHVDTAAAYGNERQVGEAVTSSGLHRAEVFLETKIWTRATGTTRRCTAATRAPASSGLTGSTC